MSQSKFEWKVGIFVFIGLVLLAGLMINFSKGLSFFRDTYELRLRAQNVGGIKEEAVVMMSGVKIGNVVDAALSTNGSVIIRLQIDEQFKIDRSARFMLDALGFLGDQYVAIISTNNTGQHLKDGDEVVAESPLNLQEAMRSTAGLLSQAQATMKTLDEAVSNVNRTVLNDTTLTSFSHAISNLQSISGNANQTLGKIDLLIVSNSPAISASVSNLFDFSTDLKSMLATNQNDIASAVQNLKKASATMNELLADVKATNGPVGVLLRDEHMKTQMGLLVTNANAMAEQLSTFGSNLNSRGVWSMLWKPKPPKKSEENR
jgi:phospholipid/cholesterol/gamma-HCH transport system substrate-binding protein